MPEGAGGGTPPTGPHAAQRRGVWDTQRDGGGGANGAFTVRSFCAICGPAGQFWLKLSNTTLLDDCRRVLWNNYADYLRTQTHHYPPLSPNVSDYDLVFALPDGRQDDDAPPIRPNEPLKQQLPRPCFLALVIGAAWLRRDTTIRREAARRQVLTEQETSELCVVERVGIMHRLRQEGWEKERIEAEQRSAEFEKRAVDAVVRELRKRETEGKLLDELRTQQLAFEAHEAEVEQLIAGYDSQKRKLLAMQRILHPTERLVEYTRERAGKKAERLRAETEAVRNRLSARPLRSPPRGPLDMGRWGLEDLHRELDDRKARGEVVSAQVARLRTGRGARDTLRATGAKPAAAKVLRTAVQ